MNQLSIAMITKNEEKNLPRCLDSVSWADEIVILDTNSTDQTIPIAQKYGAKIFHLESWQGFGLAKRFVVEQCSYEWVFVIDADEAMTRELAQEISVTLKDPQFSGYRIRRNSFYGDQLIRFSGWNKDYTLRFFNRTEGNYNSKIVHESVVLPEEKISRLNNILLHYTYPDIESHIDKMIKYSKLGAIQGKEKNKKTSILNAALRGFFKFFKMYFLNLGILDGRYGFILAMNSAFGNYLKYIYLWEINRSCDKK